jgi:hypothetical protein
MYQMRKCHDHRKPAHGAVPLPGRWTRLGKNVTIEQGGTYGTVEMFKMRDPEHEYNEAPHGRLPKGRRPPLGIRQQQCLCPLAVWQMRNLRHIHESSPQWRLPERRRPHLAEDVRVERTKKQEEKYGIFRWIITRFYWGI